MRDNCEEKARNTLESRQGCLVKRFYLRWMILMTIFGSISILGAVRYFQEVRTISPKTLLSIQPKETVRLMGMIDAGSFMKATENEPFRFDLSGEGGKVAVTYTGEDPDGLLRELKTIVVIGNWESGDGEFQAKEIALVPNYGFITSAYIFSLVPLAFFLFYMERRVALLYVMIKDEKVYQPETGQ